MHKFSLSLLFFFGCCCCCCCAATPKKGAGTKEKACTAQLRIKSTETKLMAGTSNFKKQKKTNSTTITTTSSERRKKNAHTTIHMKWNDANA